MAKYKRAKGRNMAYAKLNGHDSILPEMDMKKPAKWFQESHDVAPLVHHGKGLNRPRIAYAKRIARARNDNFYEGIRVAKNA